MKKSKNIITLFIAAKIFILQFVYTIPIYSVQIDQNQEISNLSYGEFYLRQSTIQSDAALRQDHLSRAERYFSNARDTYRSMNNDFRRRAYFGLVEVNRLQGEFSEALRICNSEVFSIRPVVYWRYKLRGMVHYDRNSWDFAERDLRQAINVDPTDVESGYYLADVYLKRSAAYLNQNRYQNSSDYIIKTNGLIKQFIKDIRFSSIQTRRDTLRNKIVNKLIDRLENAVDNYELKKIIYNHVTKNDSIAIYFYLEARKQWERDIRLAMQKFKRSTNLISNYTTNRINNFFQDKRNIAEIKLRDAVDFNASARYDSVIQYLQVVFGMMSEIDSSFVKRGLILKKDAPPEKHLEITKLYLDYDSIPDSLKIILNDIADGTKINSIERHRARFLLAVQQARDDSIKLALGNFEKILGKDSSFDEEFYFKDRKDIQARKLYAEACGDVAWMKEGLLRKYSTLNILKKGILQCEKIIELEGEKQDVKKLLKKLETKLAVVEDLRERLYYNFIILIAISFLCFLFFKFKYFKMIKKLKKSIQEKLAPPNIQELNYKLFNKHIQIISKFNKAYGCFNIFQTENSPLRWENEVYYIDMPLILKYLENICLMYKIINKKNTKEFSINVITRKTYFEFIIYNYFDEAKPKDFINSIEWLKNEALLEYSGAKQKIKKSQLIIRLPLKKE